MVNIERMATRDIEPLLKKYLRENGLDSIRIFINREYDIETISMIIPKHLSHTGDKIKLEIDGIRKVGHFTYFT